MGRATGEIAAVTFLSNLSQLSYGSIFQRFLPSAGLRSRRFILTGYVICVTLSLVLAIAYVASGLTNHFFHSSLNWSIVFILTVALYTVFALQDNVLISLRVSRWVAVENNLFGLLKLALLFPLATFAVGQGIILSWVIPLILAILIVNWYVFRRRLPDYMKTVIPAEPLPTFRCMLSLSIPQFFTAILSTLSTSVITIIVISRLGAVASADYFLVAQVAYTPALFLWSVTRPFIVESAHEPGQQRHHIFQAISALIAILFASMTIGIIFAHKILQLFGPAYADQGTTLLRLLLFALPGTAIAAIYSALAWIDGRVWQLLTREVVVMGFLLTIVMIFIRRDGINAVGYAYVVTAGLEFLVFLPATIRCIRSTPRVIVENSAPLDRQ